MGSIAKAVESRNGHVHGIIPEALIKHEQKDTIPDSSTSNSRPNTKTTIVSDMHTRKSTMAHLADAFVAMPGGYGTAEELFEVITWNQLGIHSLPVVVYNVDGFFDGLVSWINSAVEAGFISQGNRQIVVFAKSAREVVEKIENYRAADGRLDLNWSVQSPIGGKK